MVFKEFGGFERFMVDFIEGGDAVIPFEERCRVAAELDGVAVHLPDRGRGPDGRGYRGCTSRISSGQQCESGRPDDAGRCSGTRKDRSYGCPILSLRPQYKTKDGIVFAARGVQRKGVAVLLCCLM
jgi:hypothetical protein